ncbi:hypothetical protein BT96DRAFT_774947, partial [Gymnopus androsaceus JB14]
LRQEYCELELLDEITKCKYENKLSKEVAGIIRNQLIHSYCTWKGEQYVPDTVHENLRWSKEDPFIVSNGTEGAMSWNMFNNGKGKSNIRPKKTYATNP